MSVHVEAIEKRLMMSAFNLATDFSATANPSGAWTYGKVSGTTFTAFTVHDTDALGNYQTWHGSGPWPVIGKNATAATQTYTNDTPVPAGAVFAVASPDGGWTDARFTAPAAGSYTINTTFTGLNKTGPTTTVHLVVNGTPLLTQPLNGYNTVVSKSATVTLKAGDKVDFAIDYGTNKTIVNDSVQMAATLTSVTTATVSGSVFNDTNGNGIQDGSETKASGWRVYIDSDNNGMFDPNETSVLTDSSGNYSLSLAPGTYTVGVQLKRGYYQTSPHALVYTLTVNFNTSTGNVFGVKPISPA